MIDPVYALAALGSAASLIAITACVRGRTDRKNLWWAQDAWQRDCVVYENSIAKLQDSIDDLIGAGDNLGIDIDILTDELNHTIADLYTSENEVALLRSKLTRSPGVRAAVMAQRAETTRRLVECISKKEADNER